MFKNKKTIVKQKVKSIQQFLLTIPRDLKAIPFSAQVAIICLGIFMVWNTFFDFNHFFNPKQFPSIWKIINNKQAAVWKQVLLTLNGMAAFTNIICVILVALGKISNYFWGFIAVTVYGLFALAWDYVGDMQLNLFFFLPFQFIGYNLWKFNLDSQQDIISKRLNLRTSMVTIYFSVILTVFFYFEIPEFSRVVLGTYDFEGKSWTKLLPHVLDSLTNGLSIVAQILMLIRFREQWIFWIIVNILQITMYSGIAHSTIDINVLIMWIVALGNSCFGCYQWYFVRSREKLETKTKKALKYETSK
ncbi:nicotinamide riboside transporter PnuC [Spiroplasma sp. AdecLV25b]|uniref:nicotinamide riboside transporter PnuC n=1 Tax=Spiroplasma sp. AdecLV25b TaxID=3027162 RepID=UPI0027DFA77F|nr:nicotinamide riboside transporter PnuC [Spiroplasma sp. AdecLV25b]